MRLFLLVFSLLSVSFAFATVKCHDGDTCRLSVNGRVHKVRISGIDAPELGQPLADEAKEFLVQLLRQNYYSVKCEGRSYDRNTCSVVLVASGEDVGAKLVRQGLAMESPKYSKGKYRKDQEKARKEKIGIWGLAQPTSPLCYRASRQKKKYKHILSKCKKDPLYQI